MPAISSQAVSDKGCLQAGRTCQDYEEGQQNSVEGRRPEDHCSNAPRFQPCTKINVGVQQDDATKVVEVQIRPRELNPRMLLANASASVFTGQGRELGLVHTVVTLCKFLPAHKAVGGDPVYTVFNNVPVLCCTLSAHETCVRAKDLKSCRSFPKLDWQLHTVSEQITTCSRSESMFGCVP